MTVTVDNVAPAANAGENQEEYSLEMVSFNGDFYDPGTDTQAFEWDFGDKSGASGTLSPTQVYTKGGEYTITLTVTDDDGGVGTDTMTVTVISSLSIKKDALAELKIISGLYEKKVDKKIKTVVTHIEKRLDPDLWFNDDHLNAKHDHKVFDEERKAIKELMRLLDKRETPNGIVGIIQKSILKLVEADQKLANTVYTEMQETRKLIMSWRRRLRSYWKRRKDSAMSIRRVYLIRVMIRPLATTIRLGSTASAQ